MPTDLDFRRIRPEIRCLSPVCPRRRISVEPKFAVVRQATVELRTRHKISGVDGVRVPFGRGWGLVRRAVAGAKAGRAGTVAPGNAPGC
jgi:hypothetical protein